MKSMAINMPPMYVHEDDLSQVQVTSWLTWKTIGKLSFSGTGENMEVWVYCIIKFPITDCYFKIEKFHSYRTWFYNFVIIELPL